MVLKKTLRKKGEILLKKLRNFKVAAIATFLVLCVPFIAYGENNSIQGDLISENEVVEANTAESPETESSELNNPTEFGNYNETNDPEAIDKESLEITIGDIDEQKESALDEADIAEPVEEENIIEEPDEEAVENEQESEEDTEKSIEEPIEEIPAKEEKRLDEESKVLLPIQNAEQIILTSVEGLSPEAIVEFTLHGIRVGLVSNGVVTDAVPILATDKKQVKASVINKVRIVGAKINFGSFVENELSVIESADAPTEQLMSEVADPEPTEPINGNTKEQGESNSDNTAIK